MVILIERIVIIVSKLTKAQKRKKKITNNKKKILRERHESNHIKNTYKKKGLDSEKSTDDDKGDGEGRVLNKYISLMWEIKKREQVIKCLIEDRCSLVYPQVTFEVIFFQLRKILEIIAMSPMLVNEKEYRKESEKAEFDWRLGQIVKKLDSVNPNYYPAPISILSKKDCIDKFEKIEKGFLTRQDLLDAYSHCSDFLHANNPLRKTRENDFKEDVTFITNIIKKIHVLLNTHTVQPVSDGGFYYIAMGEDDKRPHGNFFGKLRNFTEEEKRQIEDNDGILPEGLSP